MLLMQLVYFRHCKRAYSSGFTPMPPQRFIQLTQKLCYED